MHPTAQDLKSVWGKLQPQIDRLYQILTTPTNQSRYKTEIEGKYLYYLGYIEIILRILRLIN